MRKFSNNGDTGLKIIIVGCGKVGATLTEQLVREGHDLTVVDRKAERVAAISNLYDVIGIVGNGASYSIQVEAGIEHADLMIAVTDSDELNLLCCAVASQAGGCASIARVRTPDYSSEIGYLRQKLGLAMIINPEYEAAVEAANILCLPSALEVNPFAHGQAELIKFKVPDGSRMSGSSIAALSQSANTRIHICAVERNGQVYIPKGNFIIQSGDIVSFVCKKSNVRTFLSEIGIKTRPVRDTMIIGGGKGAYYLATHLISMGISVKIIERDRARCERLSSLLPKAIIINGDGTDEDLLREEGIESVDSFVPLTGIDEQNVLLTLFARNNSEAKVITKVNRINFREVLSSLDLGSVIYPKYITSEAIIAYVRAKSNSVSAGIATLYHMYDHRVEAIEFNVGDGSKVAGPQIKDLRLKPNLLISFINREGSIIIPSGGDSIRSGDTVMVVTTNTGLRNVDDILA